MRRYRFPGSPGIACCTALAVWLTCLGHADAQRITTYTSNQSGLDRVAIGYPVPIPVASLTPVDGFRDHASLEMRLLGLDAEHEDLSGHAVGTTRNGRTVRAFVVSDSDGVDAEGRAEPAFFINATTHAREWAAPEVSTFLVERMMQGADDRGLVRYLLDNTRLVIIPVQNVDGFLQTQRYPDQVIVGQDPRFPTDWPRDGRMRRKNMPGVDENLTTFGDHLQGVDLNRNHPPLWGTTTQGGQLTNPIDLTYRGTSAHSEPESQALVNAAQLGPVSRMRLGVDVHTFSRVFFSSNTARQRLNDIQRRLLSTLTQHHMLVPTSAGGANGAVYQDIPDPPNSGIGAAAEYFAYQWLVPAWTLELEPQNGGQDYGGFNASHSGFILPESQVRRVREAWAETFLTAFYFMAGPPHVARVRYRDRASGELLREQRWVYSTSAGQRQLVEEGSGSFFPGRALSIEVSFSKPMRHRNAAGTLTAWPGSSQVALMPTVRVVEAAGTRVLDTSTGQWNGDAAGLRYRDDTFRFDYTVADGTSFEFEFIATDMVGLLLDANPRTAVDWQQGAWSLWEDSNGVAGDIGGIDSSLPAQGVQSAGNPAALSLIDAQARVGEGDALVLRWQRDAADVAGSIVLNGSFTGGATGSVTWESGESGVRALRIPAPEDVQVQGARSIGYTVSVAGGGTIHSGNAQVLDNDREGRSVVRVIDDLAAGLALHATSTAAQRDVVLDGGRDYPGPDTLLTVCLPFEIAAPVTLYGNRASVSPSGSSCFGPQVGGNGTAWLRDLVVRGGDGSSILASGIEVEGPALRVSRVRIENALEPAVRSSGVIQIEQSAIVDSERGSEFDSSVIVARMLQADAVTLSGAEPEQSLLRLSGNGSVVAHSTLYQNGEHVIPISFTGGSLGIRGSLIQEVNDGQDLGSPPAGPVCSGVSDLGDNWYAEDGDANCPLPDRGDINLGSRRDPVGYYLPNAQLIDQGGTDCGPVDQRGAPRPQTRTPNAEPLCDIGAVEDGVNPWRGLWIPDRSGHGIDMQTSGNVLFILWYTYADDGTPVAYQAAAPLTGPNWNAELLLASRNPQSGAITNTRVGTVRIVFASDHQAQLTWRFDAQGTEGGEGIRAYAFAVGEPRFEVTGTWYPPAESGYGASLTRRGETTAMALYYYDASGRQRWALGASNAADVVDFELSSFTGFCPDCDADAMPVLSQPVGTARVHFLTPQRASVDTDLTYPGVEGGRWQRSAAAFIPLNDPADNRETEAVLNPQPSR